MYGLLNPNYVGASIISKNTFSKEIEKDKS